ncbi:DUF998 domain-containing protein [Streptosporangium roseum]|uniref:DUF998 domain-containing protein n=1 Tax=Streptosporangium roseum (strain ATCC 12428 / DSM 43021 / JCM 3005 / KCTC 9067 / NCIMB 10171 / NRRL 2505 / NI 9100) TaxID=479432 RepID=D2B4R9_STRRD|nr:DUF998 domain-containing protein [Streptosporangium roseum]ACZ85605.1 conserved hypothetical protein [Streptosporangium roseum DSM 43021]
MRLTRSLLACGAVAGPLFIVLVLIQDYTRPGFDPRRQPLSLLSLGDLGWIQIANFVVTGLLYVAFAVGMRRVLHPGRGGTWGPLLMGAFGTGLVIAGLFRTAPGWGYPQGAPAGVPTDAGVSYVLHGAGFSVVLVSLIAACSVFTRRFAALGERRWAASCAVTGVALPTIYALSGVLSERGENSQPLSLLLRLVALVGWGWASLLAVRLRREIAAASDRAGGATGLSSNAR